MENMNLIDITSAHKGDGENTILRNYKGQDIAVLVDGLTIGKMITSNSADDVRIKKELNFFDGRTGVTYKIQLTINAKYDYFHEYKKHP